MTLNDVLDAVKSGEISQLELAQRAGLSISAISQICSSKIESPRYKTALNIIQALQDFRNGVPLIVQDENKKESRKLAGRGSEQ